MFNNTTICTKYGTFTAAIKFIKIPLYALVFEIVSKYITIEFYDSILYVV